jgi:site-specific recombinase XerC
LIPSSVTEPALPLLYGQHLARDRRRSVHTVRAYEATAVRLIAFLQSHWGGEVTREGLAGISNADLRAYLAHRRNDGLSNAFPEIRSRRCCRAAAAARAAGQERRATPDRAARSGGAG